MKKNKINILDCTLRDGGYYNNWYFKKDLINEYLKVMDIIQVDCVEIGFRFLDKIKNKGALAYSEESFLKTLKIPKDLKLAVMINAGDFISQHKMLDVAKTKFKSKKKSLISMVRIACHHHEIEKIIPLAKWLKRSGYQVGINIMQIPELSIKEIKKSVLMVKKAKADILYFADSMGSLDALKTKRIINYIRSNWKGAMGIHTHDNMGRALENSIAAIDNSVNWIDSTVSGMGRGPGNTKTEYLILQLNKVEKSQELISLFGLIDNYFNKLKKKYNWGSNPFYYYAGLNSIHPSFVQAMLADERFGLEDIYTNLKYLNTGMGKKFSNELIALDKNFYKKAKKGLWAPKELIENKDVLIIGPGESILKFKRKIIKFILKKKPLVFVLNAISVIPNKLVDAHIVCNPLRLVSDIDKYKRFKNPIITPYSYFSKAIRSKIQSNKIYDFGLKIKNKVFKFEENYVVLPNSLAITYAFGVCTSGNSNRIFLAGLDGYTKGSSKKFEMDDLLQNYKLEDKAKTITSLTPTSYKIKYIKNV